jgi:hypothetical protein
MIDLNSVVVNSLSGFTLTNATGINNIGQIVATGLNSASQEEAFILTPVHKALIVGPVFVVSGVPSDRLRSCRGREKERGDKHVR